jgi:hypothetical protein
MPTPECAARVALYSGYCGIGMRMPDLGLAIRAERSNVTPADAPAVMKMWFGFDG